MAGNGGPDDEESMAFVVQGEGLDHRSRGLVGCRLQQMDKYDHKRAHARRQADGVKKMYKIWDFIVVGDDGSDKSPCTQTTVTQKLSVQLRMGSMTTKSPGLALVGRVDQASSSTSRRSDCLRHCDLMGASVLKGGHPPPTI